MKIYFDTCCYGRQWDDQDKPEISAETTAIITIIKTCRDDGYEIWGSGAVKFELGNIPHDHPNRADIIGFYKDTVNKRYNLTQADFARARELQTQGIGAIDSQHMAAAEAIGTDVLLTVDEPFLKRIAKKNLSEVQIVNPLTYLAGGAI
ncbi:MAG: hypothetical protein LBU70_00760 [Chitinispirillales bacterium]|nr:hypothetical protein [Chitinispirillales bacterium]